MSLDDDVRVVYCDGGLIRRSPSPWGGTYAWCAVDAQDNRVASGSGVILKPELDALGIHTDVECNQVELLAVIVALAQLPDRWDGKVATDSANTIGRVFYDWRMEGIPNAWRKELRRQRARLGRFTSQKLKGHPNARELSEGRSRRSGAPVSRHNVYVDQICTALAQRVWDEMPASPKDLL